jgi:hypothetical protein
MFMGEGEEDPTDAGMHPVVSARIRPTQILGNAQGPQHCVQGVSTLSLDLTCHLSCQICYPRINEDTGAALKLLIRGSKICPPVFAPGQQAFSVLVKATVRTKTMPASF